MLCCALGLSLTELYVDLIRSSLMLVAHVCAESACICHCVSGAVLCLQGLSRTELYVELIRSSLMLVVDVVNRTDELKCAAFMFLKVCHCNSYYSLQSGPEKIARRLMHRHFVTVCQEKNI